MSFDDPTRNETITFFALFAVLLITFVLFWCGLLRFGWGPEEVPRPPPTSTPTGTTQWA